MSKHNEYIVKEERPDGTKLMECGCLWRGHTCSMADMCAEGNRVANAIKAALDTDDGRARVADLYSKAKANGGNFVHD